MTTPTRDPSIAIKALTATAGGAVSLFDRAKTALVQSGLSKLAPALKWRALAPANPTIIGGDQAAAGGGRWLFRSFAVIVALPTLAAVLYFGLIASDEYVSESRLTVRAASEEKQSLSDSMSVFSKLGLAGGKSTVQDSYLVINYIKSRSIVEDIGGAEYLEQMFSKPGIDFYARLSKERKIEEVWKYWTFHVVPVIDTLSGIVTVKVYAYSPEDAIAISKRVIDLSERLINKVSERSRAAAVGQSEMDVERAEADLARARAALQDFRNKSLTIDPVAKASAIGDLMGKMLIERSEIENAMLTFSSTLSTNSPAVRNQKNRLDALDRQIADLKQQLTSTNGNASPVASELATFEQLKLKEQFLEKKYVTAQMSLDRARGDFEKQKLFVSLVVAPGLPQYPLFPERAIDILMCFAACFVAWGIISLISASVMDHFV